MADRCRGRQQANKGKQNIITQANQMHMETKYHHTIKPNTFEDKISSHNQTNCTWKQNIITQSNQMQIKGDKISSHKQITQFLFVFLHAGNSQTIGKQSCK